MSEAGIDSACARAWFLDDVVTALKTVIPKAAETFHIGHAKMQVMLITALANHPTGFRVYYYYPKGKLHIVRYWNGEEIHTASCEVI